MKASCNFSLSVDLIKELKDRAESEHKGVSEIAEDIILLGLEASRGHLSKVLPDPLP